MLFYFFWSLLIAFIAKESRSETTYRISSLISLFDFHPFPICTCWATGNLKLCNLRCLPATLDGSWQGRKDDKGTNGNPVFHPPIDPVGTCLATMDSKFSTVLQENSTNKCISASQAVVLNIGPFTFGLVSHSEDDM